MSDINSKRYNDERYRNLSLLHLAVICENVEAIKVILENGGNTNLTTQDKYGFSYNVPKLALEPGIDGRVLGVLNDFEFHNRRYPEYRIEK